VTLLFWVRHLWANAQMRDAIKTVWLAIALGIMLWINHYGYWPGPIDPETGQPTYLTIAWPWFVPIGFAVAFALGYLLARPRAAGSHANE
jgi:hypothetical protein